MLNWPAHRYLIAINALRLLALLGQASTIAVAHYGLHLALDYALLWLLQGFALLLIALTHWRLHLRARWAVYDGELFIHLLLDTLLLFILLYQSGGATNPFVSFLLVPIALGASILTTRWIIALTALAIGAYSLLMKWHIALPGGAHIHGDGFQWHIWGMWITFVVSALLLAGFIGRAAYWARQHQQSLSNYREQKLRDEQLLSIATMAAGTAHELGTPLTTISVLIDELAPTALNSEQQQDWQLMRAQLQRCREILQRLRHHAEPSEQRPVIDIVNQISEQFALVRPQSVCQLMVQDDVKNLSWQCERPLQQALLNVMNNAADVSPQIEVEVRQESQQLVWLIRDRGQGLSADLRAQFGLPLSSAKPFGVGIGLFLTNASIERVGGRILLQDRDGGGTCVRIELPLTLIKSDV